MSQQGLPCCSCTVSSIEQPGGIVSSCVCPNTTTGNEERHRPASPQHRAGFEAVKNHLQLQPRKPGALHCLARESAPRRFLLPVTWPRWLRGLCFYATRGCWHCGVNTGNPAEITGVKGEVARGRVSNYCPAKASFSCSCYGFGEWEFPQG